jgi:hypothetical protein
MKRRKMVDKILQIGEIEAAGRKRVSADSKEFFQHEINF